MDAKPNQQMLEALKEIERIQKGMNPKKDTVDYLREGRDGEMWSENNSGKEAAHASIVSQT